MKKFKNGLWQDCRFPFYHFTSSKLSKDLKDEKARKRFCSKNSINGKDIVRANQVHGKKVRVVTEKDKGKEFPKTDGLITGLPGVYLAIFTADCMPVFMCSKDNNVVGLVHAGWRGLAKGIIPEAVKIFKNNFKVRPKDMITMIGPHIQKCCYSVGGELKKEFGLKETITHFSLAAEAARQLKKCGVKHILASKNCTCHEKKQFFSYRRDKTSHRMMSLISAGR